MFDLHAVDKILYLCEFVKKIDKILNFKIILIVFFTHYLCVTTHAFNSHSNFELINNSTCQLSVTNTNDILCFGGSDGVVLAEGTGGAGSYHYTLEIFNSNINSWQQIAQSPLGGAFSPNPVSFPSLNADCFRIIMQDSLGCSDTSNFCLNEPPILQISYNTVNAQNPITNNGSILASVTGGTPPYSFSLTDLSGNIISSLQNSNNLSYGDYVLSVIDSNGCVDSVNITVGLNQGCSLGGYFTDNVDCYGDSTGAIYISSVFGIPNYTYVLECLDSLGNWFVKTSTTSQDTFHIFNDLKAGDYKYTLIDNDSCLQTSPIISITQSDQLTINSSIINCSNITSCDGSINLDINGGNAPYFNSWNNGQDSSFAFQLCAGFYCDSITDNLGCEILWCDSIGVTPPCSDSIEIVLTIQNQSCYGNDGSIQIFASGGSGVYSYSLDSALNFSLNTFTNSVIIDSLTLGTYNVVVKDDSSCTSFFGDVIISTTPPIDIDSLITINESCCGNDGQIIVESQDPASILGYSINNLNSWQNSNVFDSLYRGYYIIYTEDINGCFDSLDIYLNVDSTPNINMTVESTDIICHGDTNGTFKLHFPNTCYEYVLWRYTLFNPQVPIDTGDYFNYLIEGYYGIIATSSSGTCVDSSNIRYIEEPDPINFNQPITSPVYCVDNNNCNGFLSLDTIPNGGIPPYQYYVNEIYTNIPNGPISSDSSFNNLCAGEYEVQVVDANACISKDTVIILDASLQVDTFLVNNVSCYGLSDGSLSVSVSGGIPPYSYQWSNSISTQLNDGLSPGPYAVIVTDSLLCNVAASFNVSEPDTLLFKIIENGKIPETCMNSSYDGQIFLEITGGNPPFSHSWIGTSGNFGFGLGDTLFNLNYDTITISVNDSNGCIGSPAWGTINTTIVDALNALNPLTIDSIITNPFPICFESNQGNIQINISSGDTPYMYSIDNGSNFYFNNYFDFLMSGLYNIVVKDKYGCLDSAKVTINQYSEILIHKDSVKNISCYNGEDGYIAITATGGVGNYTYLWNPTLETTSDINNLTEGYYTVQVTDSALCTKADTIPLIELTNPIQTTDLYIQNVSCFDYNDGEVMIDISGGMPFDNNTYDILWINEDNDTVSNSNTAQNLKKGFYLVYVTDSFSCGPFIDSIYMSEPDSFFIKVDNIKHNLCFSKNQGEIIVNTFGGNNSYITYYIQDSTGNIFQENNFIYDSLYAGSYNLWVLDSNMCLSDTLFNIKLGQPGKIISEFNIKKPSCFEFSDAEVLINIYGGIEPYEYLFYNNEDTLSYGNILDSVSIYDLYQDVFNLNIIDYNYCDVDTFIIIEHPQEIIASFSSQEIFGREEFTTTFTNNSLGSNMFIWNFDDGNILNNEDLSTISHTFLNQGQYNVSLIAYNDSLSSLCSDTFNIIIDVEGYDAFNVFSPNQDGKNDIFKFNEWMLNGMYVEIYNRWGQRIYHWDMIGGYWDGKSYNGEELPEGVYFYKMNATGVDGYQFEHQGSITLLR